MIQILGLFGMYFDAVVVEVKTFLLLFRLALAILWVSVNLTLHFPTTSQTSFGSWIFVSKLVTTLRAKIRR